MEFVLYTLILSICKLDVLSTLENISTDSNQFLIYKNIVNNTHSKQI